MLNFNFCIVSEDGREYIISIQDEKHLWISDGTGEGGAFKTEEFFKVIDKFYKDNF